VEPISEANYVCSAGDLAGKLDGGLNRIGARRTGELNHVVKASWLQDEIIQRVEKVFFRTGMKIQTVRNTIALNVRYQRFLKNWVIMTVIQRAGASQKVHKSSTFGIPYFCTACSHEGRWKTASVRLNSRFEPIKYSCLVCENGFTLL